MVDVRNAAKVSIRGMVDVMERTSEELSIGGPIGQS
jgi:hypothetical protein